MEQVPCYLVGNSLLRVFWLIKEDTGIVEVVEFRQREAGEIKYVLMLGFGEVVCEPISGKVEIILTKNVAIWLCRVETAPEGTISDSPGPS